MACFHPLKGYYSTERSPQGKRRFVVSSRQAYHDLTIDVPCGQCMGCRLERSRQWAVRCVHEASLYEENCFVTLTYSPENLPLFGSLEVEDFQKFMKKLRKKFDRPIRYFHCGEYGERLQRPHYHACLFNLDFPDKEFWKEERGNKLYRSALLEETWGLGHCSVGALTFESAAYVARYITKKQTGRRAEEHYEFVDPFTGEYRQKKPEYVTMSRRPGIGAGWLEKYRSDVYPSDFIVVRGKKMKPPKFYLDILKRDFPEEYARLKARRKGGAEKIAENNTHERLLVREEVLFEKTKMLRRSYESEK